VAFSADGKRIVSSSNSAQGNTTKVEIKVWDAITGSETFTLVRHIDTLEIVRVSPDGKRIATMCSDNTVKIWDAEQGREILTLQGHSFNISSMAFSPNGKRIVTGSGSGVKIWDAKRGSEILTLDGYTGIVWSVVFSPDGKRIVAGCHDNTIRIWEADHQAQP
jgi:WD40 repeat protein